jgi:hypothetical protein
LAEFISFDKTVEENVGPEDGGGLSSKTAVVYCDRHAEHYTVNQCRTGRKTRGAV